MTNRVRKLAKPFVALAVVGLLGQALMPWCIGSAVASVFSASPVLAAGEHPGQTGDSRSSPSHHCCPPDVDFGSPPSRDADCCDWAGVSPFAGHTGRGVLPAPQPDLQAAPPTAVIVAAPRRAVRHAPLPVDPPTLYTRPLYLLDCAFLE